MTGVQAADWLEQHCHITVELADQRRIMALVTLADSDESVDRLIAGLRELAAWAGENSPGETVTMPPMADMETELVQSPREAILGPAREIRLVDAPGQIAAEMISPYPPGIPAITPGERFTEPIVEFLRAVLEMGIAIPDASDPSLETVRVVA
jgi:lysine decarboxylase